MVFQFPLKRLWKLVFYFLLIILTRNTKAMLIRIRTILLILLFIFLANASFSQQTWPSTLLWRISGNGLTKPSFLYGTMHLQDKRLFNFGDSLYQSLEKVEGFALEIDFKEYLDSMFINQLQKTLSRLTGPPTQC
jgi:uncharacterized protein YbaP (TraB family)